MASQLQLENYILNAAMRLRQKHQNSPYYRMNGSLPDSVKAEIKRLIKHCKELEKHVSYQDRKSTELGR